MANSELKLAADDSLLSCKINSQAGQAALSADLVSLMKWAQKSKICFLIWRSVKWK